MKRIILIFAIVVFSLNTRAQTSITVQGDSGRHVISKHIYGHFAEHLGRCIYGGFYVGENNKAINNKNGLRLDVIEALNKLKVPNLRWPGGCFADTYHWKEAVGPKDKRKPIENMSWGNIREDNSFGTNEFLELCEMLNAEPYLAVNVNSGSVQEAVEWVQYVNHANGTSSITDLRNSTGRTTPWNVKFWGIGNESWDCGGAMTADHYANLYKQYATAITTYGNTEKLFRIAVGPGTEDYSWTETIMRNVPIRRMEGLSVHHYSVINWSKKSSSTQFSDEEYFKTMQSAWRMENFVTKNAEVMDKYDPDKKVALIVDEWGGWYETDPEGNGALYQQNTIRDAMIAGLTLNIFNNHADRVRMANLAQTINVLQAVILTKEDKMILTPTYHVMEMYNVHQDAMLLPITLRSTDFIFGNEKLPAVSASASRDKAGVVHISLANIDISKPQTVTVRLAGIKAKVVNGRILSSQKVQDHNTFENPDKVVPKNFTDASLKGDVLTVKLPAASVVVLEVK